MLSYQLIRNSCYTPLGSITNFFLLVSFYKSYLPIYWSIPFIPLLGFRAPLPIQRPPGPDSSLDSLFCVQPQGVPTITPSKMHLSTLCNNYFFSHQEYTLRNTLHHHQLRRLYPPQPPLPSPSLRYNALHLQPCPGTRIFPEIISISFVGNLPRDCWRWRRIKVMKKKVI